MTEKSKRQVSIYFDSLEQKQKFESDARRYGVTTAKLIKMSLEVGRPIVVRSLRAMKSQQTQAVKPASK